MLTSTVSEVPVEFSIDPSSRLPICRQLNRQIREAVARGRLQPDQRLPSVRELSRSLVVNPNTIARVYADLEREGVLNTRQGLGVFVARGGSELSRKVRRQRLGPQMRQIEFFLGRIQPAKTPEPADVPEI